MVSVLIVDDHSLFVNGLSVLFEEFPSVSVIGKAYNGVEAIEFVKLNRPDVVLLDLRMPKMDGYQAFDFLAKEYPEVKIIILSMDKEEQITSYFLNKGAYEVLDKSTDIEIIVKKIHQITNTSDLYNKSLQLKRQQIENILSKRQIEILSRIGIGQPHKNIANDLGISERTVEYHKAILYKKLEAKCNADLIRYAFQYGYL